MFSIFGTLADFERYLVHERANVIENRAKAKGVEMGRPSKINEGLPSVIQLIRQKGLGTKKIATECGFGIGTVYSII